MLPLSQAARDLGVPVHILKYAARVGTLPTVQHIVGGRRYVLPQDLADFRRTRIDPVRNPQ